MDITFAMWVFFQLQGRDVRYELLTPPPGDIAFRIEINPVHPVTIRDDPYPGWKPPGNLPKGKGRWR